MHGLTEQDLCRVCALCSWVQVRSLEPAVNLRRFLTGGLRERFPDTAAKVEALGWSHLGELARVVERRQLRQDWATE
jgi:hypothetical protein